MATTPVGIIMFVSPEFAKAQAPIFVTLFGICTELKFGPKENPGMELPILVTGKKLIWLGMVIASSEPVYSLIVMDPLLVLNSYGIMGYQRTAG